MSSAFVGRIETVSGACTLCRGEAASVAIKTGDAVCQDDIIATAADGRVSIRFIDGTSFTVANDARVVVKEFACGGASPSARFDVVSGTFAFVAGDIAKAGHFEIDTAVARIRGRARSGGMGMLTLTALMFAVMDEARADGPGEGFLDDGTITYNGVFEVTTKEAVPKHYVVDNPVESLVLHRIGSSINADQTINTAQIMDQLHAAQQDALHIFALGLSQGPTITGPGGSGDPPLSGPPTFFQPINFTPPPTGGPPTGPSGPPNPGPPPGPPTPQFFDVFFTPPPAAPGKINEIVGHTGDAAPDVTSNSLGLPSGSATVGTPTFVWSGGPLTSGDQTNLAAASTLTLSDSGGFITYQYSAQDKTFDFLAAGETLTVTYDVTANGITQQAVVIITGTNDVPHITSSAQIGTITEETHTPPPNPTGSSDLDHASGTVTFTDADLTDRHQIAVTGVEASGVTTGLADNATVMGWLTLGPLSDSTGGVTGSDVWTFSAQDKSFDYLAKDETLTLTYTVKVDDGNGASDNTTVTITITGTNDTPVIASSTQAATITEDHGTIGSGGESGPEGASGTITFTDVDLSDHETSTILSKQVVDAQTHLENGYVLTTDQQNALLDAFTIDPATHSTEDGSGAVGWHYSIDDGALDFLGAKDVVTLTYTVQVDDGNGGTATQDVTITLQGTEDFPVIASATQAATITEDRGTVGSGGESGPECASGTITFTDVDLSDIEKSSFTVKEVSTTLANGYTLTTDQQNALADAFNIGDATHSSADGTGTIGWHYSIDDSALDFLGANDVVTLTYTVKVDDGNGGTATQDVTITVQGTEDFPVIASATQAATITEDADGAPLENHETHSASGTITFTDVDLSDHETSSIVNTQVNATLANGYTLTTDQQNVLADAFNIDDATHSTEDGSGAIGWHYSIDDSALDFLGAKDVVTLTYTVQVDDGNGGTATQDVTITVHGTEDVPVIASATQAATITEDHGTVGSGGESGPEGASGTITFTDVDLSDIEKGSFTLKQMSTTLANGYTLTAGQQNALVDAFGIGDATHSTEDGSGAIGWHYSIDDSTLDFLGANDVVTLTYTVKVDDGNGGTATQDVTITLHGTNDTPVINLADGDSAVAELTESYKTQSASGTLTVTDVDLSDTVTATVKDVSLGGTTGGLTSADVLGMLSVTPTTLSADPSDTHNLVWNFKSAPQAFGFLDAGESLTLNYTVQVNDGHGGITSQIVTITVDGTDQPDLVTSFSHIDSQGYFDENRPAVEHVSDGGVDVTSQVTYQWQVFIPGFWIFPGHWTTVSTSNSFSQVETWEGYQLRVTASYSESGGNDTITTYLGQISDNDSDDHHAQVRIQNLSNDLQVATGTALELAAATSLAVFFPTSADAYGKLVIDHATSYTGQIHNFAGTSTQSDAIDLRDIAYTSDLSLSYSDNIYHDTGGTLSILKSGHVIDTIKFGDGDYTVDNFAIASDGHGGIIISDPPTASDALTTGTDTFSLDTGAHSVTGTDHTVNNGDTISGHGGDTVTIDSGNGDQSYAFGDGHHADVGMTGIDTLTLTDSAATSGHAVDVTFDSSFSNNGTLTVDGSGFTHLDGARLTVDAHLATSDAFVFVGSSGADTLIGGAKADTIIGGGGGDTLTGGGGNDTFVFKAVTDSQPGAGHFDVITDFTHNTDHLDLSAIDGLNSSVQTVNFVAGTSAPASLAAHTIDIVTTGADTVVYANASGSAETAGHADMEIHLHNVTHVQSSDFILHG